MPPGLPSRRLHLRTAARQRYKARSVSGSPAPLPQTSVSAGVPVQSQGLVRVIAPGQAVTQDYRENRLNLETDASGNLVRANCA
jgi:hypothetical protein